MPQCDIHVTITVRAVKENGDAKQHDVTYTMPKNGTPGCVIADPGKMKIGTAAEQLADLLDRDKTAL